MWAVTWIFQVWLAALLDQMSRLGQHVSSTGWWYMILCLSGDEEPDREEEAAYDLRPPDIVQHQQAVL